MRLCLSHRDIIAKCSRALNLTSTIFPELRTSFYAISSHTFPPHFLPGSTQSRVLYETASEDEKPTDVALANHSLTK